MRAISEFHTATQSCTRNVSDVGKMQYWSMLNVVISATPGVHLMSPICHWGCVKLDWLMCALMCRCGRGRSPQGGRGLHDGRRQPVATEQQHWGQRPPQDRRHCSACGSCQRIRQCYEVSTAVRQVFVLRGMGKGRGGCRTAISGIWSQTLWHHCSS